MILASKMMLDWLGEVYKDAECTKAADSIEKAVIQTLKEGITVPDFGGNTTTLGMAEAIARTLRE